ncbi:MAG: anti-sigma factor family protein [Armatimonadota bacterium]
MLCNRVQNLLSAYIDSELTGQEMLSIRGHVERCPDCRQELESLRGVKRLFASLDTPAAVPAFSMEAVEERLRERSASATVARGFARLVRPLKTLAASARRAASYRLAGSMLAREAPVPLMMGGAAMLAALAIGVIQQPQAPDAVSARVPALIAAEPDPHVHWQLQPLLPAIDPHAQPVYYDAGRLPRRLPLGFTPAPGAHALRTVSFERYPSHRALR